MLEVNFTTSYKEHKLYNHGEESTINRKVTTCLLGDKGDPALEASVVHHTHDRDNQAKAQKYALAKALKKGVKKEERKEYWDWFFNHSKKAKNLL